MKTHTRSSSSRTHSAISPRTPENAHTPRRHATKWDQMGQNRTFLTKNSVYTTLCPADPAHPRTRHLIALETTAPAPSPAEPLGKHEWTHPTRRTAMMRLVGVAGARAPAGGWMSLAYLSEANPMAKANPVIWFEIPVKNLERAKAFYEAVLGIALAPPIESVGSRLSFFPMDMNALGAGGALIESPRLEPSTQGTTVYFSVPSIDPVLYRVKTAGGKVCMPRTSLGQYGFMAHFEDTEGNRAALHEVGGM